MQIVLVRFAQRPRVEERDVICRRVVQRREEMCVVGNVDVV